MSHHNHSDTTQLPIPEYNLSLNYGRYLILINTDNEVAALVRAYTLTRMVVINKYYIFIRAITPPSLVQLGEGYGTDAITERGIPIIDVAVLHVKANKKDVVPLVGGRAREAGTQLRHGTPHTLDTHEEMGIGKQDDRALLVQVTQDVIDGGRALLHHHPMILSCLEALRHPLGVFMEDMVIESFGGESRVDTQSNCHVAVLDAKPLKQIRKVNAPCTLSEAFLLTYFIELRGELDPCCRREDHVDAGQATVPGVTLLHMLHHQHHPVLLGLGTPHGHRGIMI